MSLPGDLTTATLTGKYVDSAGVPQAGRITLTPSAVLADATGSVVIPPVTRAYVISAQGTFITDALVATDCGTISPQGWQYVVQLSIAGLQPQSWSILLPASGSPVDISTITPAVPQAAVTSYLPQSGGTVSGQLTLAGGLQIPSGAASGDVLTSDSAGNASWGPITAAEIPAAASGAIGGVELNTDLGGTAAAPQVVGTHLATPLPIGQGGTNAMSAGAALMALGAASAAALAAETSRAETAEALALAKASNLSDLASASTARTNLGLGTAATQASSAFDTSGSAAAAQAAAIAASLPTLTANVSVTSSGTLALNTVTGVSAGSNLTMTLPSSTAGDVIVCEKSDSSTNTVTVTGNIRGVGSTSLVLKLQNESMMLLGYAGSWWPVAGHKTLGSLDSRYTQFVNVLAFGADATGTNDSTSAIDAALTVVSASNKGATVFFPAGSYKISGTLTADSSSGVTLLGCGGTTAGAAAGTKLIFSNTGSGALISAVSSIGFRLRGIQVVYSSSSFTGNMLDLRNVSAGDTALFRVDDCLFAASSTASANACIALDKANTGMITGCNFEGATYGILGRASGASYSNANVVTGCQFVDLVTAGIRNPGQGWLISGDTFENLSGGGAGGILCDSGAGTYGTEISGNWFGDATVNSGSPISINGGGLSIHGNYIGYITGMTAVVIGNNSVGFAINANRFDNGGGTGTTAITIGTSCSSYNCTGNGGAGLGLPSPQTDFLPSGTIYAFAHNYAMP